MKVYLSGKMRGVKDYNFPAFHAAEFDLLSRGYEVLSPASLDVDEGFNIKTPSDELTPEQLNKWIKRDSEMVLEADAIALLPNSTGSKGVAVEIAIAKFAGKPVYLYPEMNLLEIQTSMIIPENDVLIEALNLTSGDRQNQYGAPDQDFARTAAMWSALKGVDFTTEEVAAFQVCIKLSRNTHQSKRDNWVDIAGYARCGDICRQEKEKRNGCNTKSS
jgi:hypothetical protein